MNKKKVFYDDQERTISIDDKSSAKLTNFEYLLFKKLVENQGNYITSDSLVLYMWKEEAESYKKDSSNLIQLVSKLRRQISIFGDCLSIQGKRGLGYSLNVSEEYELLDSSSYTLSMLHDDLSSAFKNDIKNEINEKSNFSLKDLFFVFLLSFFITVFYISRQITIPDVSLLANEEVIECGDGIYASSEVSCHDTRKLDDLGTMLFSKNEESILFSRVK